MRNRVGSAAPSARQKKETNKCIALIYTFGFTFLMGIAAFVLFSFDSGTLGKPAETMRLLGSSILAIPPTLIAVMTGVVYKMPRCCGYAFFILVSFVFIRFIGLDKNGRTRILASCSQASPPLRLALPCSADFSKSTPF
ncbi:MAG: hypothetical protein HN844_06865 [Planctomycetes bacterium]|nr:hypothetical protein [Planctomycetota bacterium]MBT7318925.1 hypothetical protein [Planctomycetota bacterium]